MRGVRKNDIAKTRNAVCLSLCRVVVCLCRNGKNKSPQVHCTRWYRYRHTVVVRSVVTVLTLRFELRRPTRGQQARRAGKAASSSTGVPSLASHGWRGG